MATAGGNTIIIIKKKASGHHEEHGNTAWKIAYADFVTAMMAFFLLLWLLNSVTEEQMVGLTNYFAPTSVSYTKSGSGGVLGGTDVMKDGAMNDSQAAVGIQQGAMSNSEDSVEDASPTDLGQPFTAPGDADNVSPTGEASGSGAVDADNYAAADKARLQAMEQDLAEALESSPELKELAKHVVMDMTQEGLRIQIVDLENRSLFESGSSRLSATAAKLLRQVAGSIADAPNDIKVSGHTDATPYATNNTYSNWELSADRALASRRALIATGVPESRIVEVVGQADTQPFDPADPFAPVNRRIAIVIKNLAPAVAPDPVKPANDTP